MEMENSALIQVMATQTSILEEIRELRRKETMQGMVPTVSPANASAQISSSEQVAQVAPVADIEMIEPPMQDMGMQPIEPFAPEEYYSVTPPAAMATTPTAPPVANPLAYSSVSKIPVVGGVAGAATLGVEDAISFDPSRLSKEATAEYFAQRSRGVQLGTVEGAGNVIEGAGAVAGFMAGGIVTSLAVGGAVAAGTTYVASEMSQGAEAALNYQDILRRDGYKAFNALESTTEYGGIGMSLDDQQDVASFMREEAVNNFLEDDEMSQILQGSLDNKLMKSVDDVKSFKDKFSGIVKAVKEISITLDKTIDEAIEFMGEMERRGVATDKMTGIAAGAKVGASFLGISEEEFTQNMLQQTDLIVGGTTTNTENVMEGIGFNAYLATAVANVSKEGDGVLSQYMKNNGGEAAVAGQVESDLRGFYTGAGQDKLLGLFGGAFEQDEEGNFSLNQQKLDELMNSGMTQSELMDASTAALADLDNSSKARLASSVGSVFNQNADSQQLFETSQFIMEKFQESTGGEMDSETALMSMGLAGDAEHARLLDEFIAAGSSEDAQNQYGALSLKEEMDSERLASSPGLKKRAKFWWKRTVEEPLGDIGEFIANETGDVSQDLQMWMSGIEETGLVGGDMVTEMDEETSRELFTGPESNNEKIYDALKDLNPDLEAPGKVEERSQEKISYTTGEFEKMIEQLDAGELSASDLSTMRENLENERYSTSAEDQVNYILNKATGEYEGVLGKASQFIDWTQGTAKLNLSNEEIRKGDFSSIEEIKKQEEEITKEAEKTNKELAKLLSGDNDIGVDKEKYGELEELVKSGDVTGVASLTSDKDVLDIAKKYEGQVERSEKLKGASDLYKENFKNTQGLLTLTGSLYDFIDSANIHEEDEFDMYYGQKRKHMNVEMNAQSKSLKFMDDQEMADVFSFAMDERQNALESISEQERLLLAEKVTASNSAVRLEDMYVEGGMEIDVEKLNEQILNLQRVQNTDEHAGENALRGNGEEVSRAADEHAEALDTFTQTLMAETGRLNDAVDAIKSKNYSNYTRINT